MAGRWASPQIQWFLVIGWASVGPSSTSGFTGLLSLIPGILALPRRPQPLKWEVFLPKLLLVTRDLNLTQAV